jgi:hypothetical protein
MPMPKNAKKTWIDSSEERLKIHPQEKQNILYPKKLTIPQQFDKLQVTSVFYICIELKDKKMNKYPKLHTTFAFWLVQQFLPLDDSGEETQPISNREFYSIMAMILFALGLLKVAFHFIAH